MVNRLAVAGNNSRFKQPEAKPAGFWAGYWHGSIALITLVVSLFNKDVSMYETCNNGAWYNLGFLLGASSALGGKVNVKVNKPETQTPAEPETPQPPTESED
jgi:hypothetical protein